MARPDDASFSPALALANRSLRLGVGALLLAAGATLTVGPLVGMMPLAFGALLLWAAWLTRSSAKAAEALNRAWDATSRGRLAEAQEILDGMARTFQLAYIRHAMDVCRARVAFRRGDLTEALRQCSAAADRGLGVLGRAYGRKYRIDARALRAVVRGAVGDANGARADAAAVRASHEASPEALARAELAEAMLLEKHGDRAALGAHLAAHAPLLAEHTTPRERAIVRAYGRLIKARPGSVYREGAPKEPVASAVNEPSVEDWMAKVAPAAAPFARVGRATGSDAHLDRERVDPALRDAVVARLASRAKGAPRRGAKLVGGWVLLVVLFLGIWQFLSPASPPESRRAVATATSTAAETGVLLTWIPLVFLAVFAALLMYRIGGTDRQARRILAAMRREARGERDLAEKELVALSKSRLPLVAGQADVQLAFAAERRSAFAEALAHCDRGLAAVAVTVASNAVASSYVTPELLAERALLLAATGREAEAVAEMAHVSSAFPSFPLLARAERRFGVLLRARRGDLAGAAALAGDEGCDAPLPARDDLLGELVRIAAAPDAARAEDIARVKEELRDDGDARRWIEAVAPAALDAFDAREHAAEAARADADADAEREAHAEEEASALAASATAAR